jgi:hypothetical protein
MDPEMGEAMVLGGLALVLISLLVIITRYRARHNTDPNMATSSWESLGIPEDGSFHRPKLVVSAITSGHAREDGSVSTPSKASTHTQVQPQPIIEEVEEEMPEDEEPEYGHKTCDVFFNSDIPMLELGAISDQSIDQDGLFHALSQPGDKGLSFKLGRQDVLIAANEEAVEDFDPDQPIEDQYDNINRVRIWSNNVLVFDQDVADFDPTNFDGIEIDGLLKNGTAVWIAVGSDTRVLFQEV